MTRLGSLSVGMQKKCRLRHKIRACGVAAPKMSVRFASA
jgi:hypothetical protein